MILLLDGNILAASARSTHRHHQRVTSWFGTLTNEFATCVITQRTLLRLHMKLALDTSAKAAWAALDRVRNHPRHLFWHDPFGYEQVANARVQGHRQVTDAWLAEFARRHGGSWPPWTRGSRQISRTWPCSSHDLP